jgi:hypothetical protein
MRAESSLPTLLLTALAAVLLIATVWLSPVIEAAEAVRAGHLATVSSPGADCRCEGAAAAREPAVSAEPARPLPLDGEDEVAALEALHYGLSEVADGQTYVWHRRHGRLSGFVHPTRSFKDAAGAVCRHVVVTLTSGRYSRRSEAIACRETGGRWVVAG